MVHDPKPQLATLGRTLASAWVPPSVCVAARILAKRLFWCPCWHLATSQAFRSDCGLGKLLRSAWLGSWTKFRGRCSVKSSVPNKGTLESTDLTLARGAARSIARVMIVWRSSGVGEFPFAPSPYRGPILEGRPSPEGRSENRSRKRKVTAISQHLGRAPDPWGNGGTAAC